VTLRALIVDDEPLARDRVRALLQRDAEVEIAGEAGDGDAALRELSRWSPEICFLDVQMPGMDGFEVLRRAPRLPRAVVFVTAWNEHAVRAFDVNAADYLLKPYDEERFGRALARAKSRARSGLDEELLRAVLRSLPPALERIQVRDRGRIVLVDPSSIDWVQAAGNYLELHAGGETHLHRETLASLEERMGDRLVRIHRSTLVNPMRVRELRALEGGDHEVVLHDRTRLVLSRGYQSELPKLVGARRA
jgi:two-component system, LytTR family, response regulator